MKPIQAIDVHGHYGVCQRDELSELVNRFTTGDAVTVVLGLSRAKSLLPKRESRTPAWPMTKAETCDVALEAV